jgi:hypothetical protein
LLGPSGRLGARVAHPDDHALDTGGYQGIGARRRLAVVTAGLERHVRGSTSSCGTRIKQREDLGVWITSARVEALADDAAARHDDTPDQRIGRCRA